MPGARTAQRGGASGMQIHMWMDSGGLAVWQEAADPNDKKVKRNPQ